MRPLEGVVIKVGAEIKVRLLSRAVVTIPWHRDLRLGDTCFILYDFTRMEVRDIWTEAEYFTEEDISGVEREFPLPPEWAEASEFAVDPNLDPDVSL